MATAAATTTTATTDAAKNDVVGDSKKSSTVALCHKYQQTHPVYTVMVKEAITALKERGGSSRLALLKYMIHKYNVGLDDKAVNSRLKRTLLKGVTDGWLKQSKGTGAAGSFKLNSEQKPQPKKPKEKKSKKQENVTDVDTLKRSVSDDTRNNVKGDDVGSGGKDKVKKIAKTSELECMKSKPAGTLKDKTASKSKSKSAAAAAAAAAAGDDKTEKRVKTTKRTTTKSPVKTIQKPHKTTRKTATKTIKENTSDTDNSMDQ